MRFPAVTHILGVVEQGAPAALTIEGVPECQIRIEPERLRMEVLVRDDKSAPDVRTMRNLGTYSGKIDDQYWNALWADWTHTPIEVYQFTCDVIDRIQQLGDTLAVATEVVLLGMRSLLRSQSKMSRDAEIGLIGELLVLERVANGTSPQTAVKAWLGPQREEHDFVLNDCDLEVKATSSETRSHWISSISQLTRVGQRPLTLHSVQLTPKDGDGSENLGSLVTRLLSLPEMPKGEFLEKLEQAGFSLADQDLYPTKWALRGPILEFSVEGDFPRLDLEHLMKSDLDFQRIAEMSYRINLEGMEPSAPKF